MRKITRSIVVRGLAAATSGLVMTGVSFVIAFQVMHDEYPYVHSHQVTFHKITSIMKHLELFHQQTGRYPEHLAELQSMTDDYIGLDSANEVLDLWNRPLKYWSDGERYSLRSLGLDGKPGGLGLNKDLDSRNFVRRDDDYVFPRSAFSPTLRQFTFELDTAPSKIACGFAGLFTASVCFVSLSHLHDVEPKVLGVLGVLGVLTRLTTTILACLFITVFLAALHVPNGH